MTNSSDCPCWRATCFKYSGFKLVTQSWSVLALALLWRHRTSDCLYICNSDPLWINYLSRCIASIQGGHQPGKVVNLTGWGKVWKWKKSAKMCFACGVLLRLWLTQLLWAVLFLDRQYKKVDVIKNSDFTGLRIYRMFIHTFLFTHEFT